DAREAEAEPARGAARRLVAGVALPLQPAVAQIVHGVSHEQEKRLGGGSRPLQHRRQPDMPDLDAAVLRHDVEIAGHAAGLPAAGLADRVEQRVVNGGAVAEPALEGADLRPRTVTQEPPQLPAA